MNSHKHVFWILIFALLFVSTPSHSGPLGNMPKPGKQDTCPVCGMFVTKYPEWVATVLYKNGHAHHFDGAKDMFKYLLDMPKWAPGHKPEDIQSIGVTEYYGLTLINARDAVYVIGSDVLGPMGHELIPLEIREDAEVFLKDHNGLRIMRFPDVATELLKRMDMGQFE